MKQFTWKYFELDNQPPTVLGLCYLDGKPYSRVFVGAALIATRKEAVALAEKLGAKFTEEPLPPEQK